MKESVVNVMAKWSPVLESRFGGIDNKRKEIMCRYAESHAHDESSYQTSSDLATIGHGDSTLLPVALGVLYNVLKNLDLDETEVIVMSGPTGVFDGRFIEAKSLVISEDITYDEKMDLSKQFGMDLVGMIEKKLSDRLSRVISNGLVDAKIFAPYLMVQSIQTISEGTSSKPRIAMKSRYGIVKRDKPNGIDFRDPTFVKGLTDEVHVFSSRGSDKTKAAFADVLKSLDHLNATLSRENFYEVSNELF